MNDAPIFVDGILIDWTDRLFFPEYKKPRPDNGEAALLYLLLSQNDPKRKAERARANIERTAKRTPEVMVKITSKKGAGRGMARIRAHIDYISRNGKVDIEDQDGFLIRGKKELEGMKRYWQFSGGRAISEESERRDSLNIIFSMPSGTPSHPIREAVKDFIKEEFAGREYVFALHTDTPQPHVHVCVKTQPAAGGIKKLDPRKSDLSRWRQGFAESLRKRGIQANATPRLTRGVIKQPIRQSDLHRLLRLNQQAQGMTVPLGTAKSAFSARGGAWKQIARALVDSTIPGDKKLAGHVIEFLKTLPIREEVKNHERDERLRYLRKVALYQPNLAGVKDPRSIRSGTGLRTLSSIPLVYDRDNKGRMLLHKDGIDFLDRQREAGHSVRRTDSGARGAKKGTLVLPLKKQPKSNK